VISHLLQHSLNYLTRSGNGVCLFYNPQNHRGQYCKKNMNYVSLVIYYKLQVQTQANWQIASLQASLIRWDDTAADTGHFD